MTVTSLIEGYQVTRIALIACLLRMKKVNIDYDDDGFDIADEFNNNISSELFVSYNSVSDIFVLGFSLGEMESGLGDSVVKKVCNAFDIKEIKFFVDEMSNLGLKEFIVGSPSLYLYTF